MGNESPEKTVGDLWSNATSSGGGDKGGGGGFFNISGGRFLQDLGINTGGNSTPDPTAPPAAPLPGSTTTSALVQEMKQERQMASAGTMLAGGGQGLLDEPTTASRVLLGS